MKMRRALRQGRWEWRQLMRNGEQLLISFILPILALIALVNLKIFEMDDPRFGLAAAIAMGVLSSSFTSQAIQLAMDRRYGVLRMFATTALGPGGLLAGKALAVSGVLVIQGLVLALTAWLAGIRDVPLTAWGLIPLAMLVGVFVHVGFAVMIGGTLRAEAVIAVANLLWVIMLSAGALLPPSLGVLRFLPPGAMGDALRAAVTGHFDGVALLVMAMWGLLFAFIAKRSLRWE